MKSEKSDSRNEEPGEHKITIATTSQGWDHKGQNVSQETSGGYQSKPLTPGRTPLGELQSPPAKRPRQAITKANAASKRNMVVSPPSLPVHKGLVKVKLESDFYRVSTKFEPVDY